MLGNDLKPEIPGRECQPLSTPPPPLRIVITTTAGSNGLIYSIKNPQKEFLSQLELVDNATAKELIRKSRNIKNFHRERTEALVKKMLSKKPRFRLENGKVIRIQNSATKLKTKTRRKLQKKKQAELYSMYAAIRNYENSINQENLIGKDRCHLSRKTSPGIELSPRSKMILDSCPTVSVRIHRMNDEEIAHQMQYEIFKNKDKVAKHLKLNSFAFNNNERKVSFETITRNLYRHNPLKFRFGNSGKQSSVTSFTQTRTSCFTENKVESYNSNIAKSKRNNYRRRVCAG